MFLSISNTTKTVGLVAFTKENIEKISKLFSCKKILKPLKTIDLYTLDAKCMRKSTLLKYYLILVKP